MTKSLVMNRQERIRVFITEQCRHEDRSYRNSLFPRQILLGDTPLPLPEDAKMTFKINPKKKICFRFSVRTQNGLFHAGFPLTQIESLSFKEMTTKHPEAALVFLLKKEALEKFVDICMGTDPQVLDDPLGNGNKKSMSRYLTVILREDNNAQGGQKGVYMRINLRGMIFTFTAAIAKQMMMKDLEIMWNAVLDKDWELETRCGTNIDREDKMGEMDDEAWDWFMSYLEMEWKSSPGGGLLFSKINYVPSQPTFLDPLGSTYMSPTQQSSPYNGSSPTHEPSLLSEEYLDPNSLPYSETVLGSTGTTTPQ